jgi:hypothetical protein
MQTPTRPDSPTLRAHRRQLVWQILLPVLLVVLLGVAAGVFVARAGVPGDRLGADVALIWLIAPLLAVALILLVLLAAMVYGMARLLQIVPRFTGRAQEIAGRIEGGTKKAADVAAGPILWVHEVVAVIDSFLKKL